MKKIIGLTFLASVLPIAAMAGGMNRPVSAGATDTAVPVILADGIDWTGSYAGAALGFGGVDAAGGKDDAKGSYIALDLGYRRDFGMVVLGGEVSLTKNDLGVGGNTDQINSSSAAQVMLGADLGRTLVYVSSGIARANATVTSSTGFGTGYSVGLGADVMLNDKFTIGGELVSSKFNDFRNSGVDLKDTSLGMKVGLQF